MGEIEDEIKKTGSSNQLPTQVTSQQGYVTWEEVFNAGGAAGIKKGNTKVVLPDSLDPIGNNAPTGSPNAPSSLDTQKGIEAIEQIYETNQTVKDIESKQGGGADINGVGSIRRPQETVIVSDNVTFNPDGIPNGVAGLPSPQAQKGTSQINSVVSPATAKDIPIGNNEGVSINGVPYVRLPQSSVSSIDNLSFNPNPIKDGLKGLSSPDNVTALITPDGVFVPNPDILGGVQEATSSPLTYPLSPQRVFLKL